MTLYTGRSSYISYKKVHKYAGRLLCRHWLCKLDFNQGWIGGGGNTIIPTSILVFSYEYFKIITIIASPPPHPTPQTTNVNIRITLCMTPYIILILITTRKITKFITISHIQYQNL